LCGHLVAAFSAKHRFASFLMGALPHTPAAAAGKALPRYATGRTPLLRLSLLTRFLASLRVYAGVAGCALE